MPYRDEDGRDDELGAGVHRGLCVLHTHDGAAPDLRASAKERAGKKAKGESA
jgi:hypothetical protein